MAPFRTVISVENEDLISHSSYVFNHEFYSNMSLFATQKASFKSQNFVTVNGQKIFGSVFGKRDLLAIFHVMKYDVKYPFKCCKPFLNIPDRI